MNYLTKKDQQNIVGLQNLCQTSPYSIIILCEVTLIPSEILII
jgi:hypothetical protein